MTESPRIPQDVTVRTTVPSLLIRTGNAFSETKEIQKLKDHKHDKLRHLSNGTGPAERETVGPQSLSLPPAQALPHLRPTRVREP